MTAPATGVRARTRRAIVEAAVAVLAADPAASLGDVAAAADVSRTTVHRYFPDRSSLLRAVAEDAVARIAAALARARLDQGSAAEALARACRELFDLGPVLTVVFAETVDITDDDWARCAEDAGGGLAAAVARGHAEGDIDTALSIPWVEGLVWALLYTAWVHGRENDVPHREGLDLCVRTLRKAVAP